MGIFNLRGVLSAVALSVVMGSTAASAAVVDLYQITVKGTMAGGFPSLDRLNPSPFAPARGKSFELVFSMPMEGAQESGIPGIRFFKGNLDAKYDGATIEDGSLSDDDVMLRARNADTRSLQILGTLTGDSFGFRAFDYDINIGVQFNAANAVGIDLPRELPLDLSPPNFKSSTMILSARSPA